MMKLLHELPNQQELEVRFQGPLFHLAFIQLQREASRYNRAIFVSSAMSVKQGMSLEELVMEATRDFQARCSVICCKQFVEPAWGIFDGKVYLIGLKSTIHKEDKSDG